jgi:hypothetical protein
LKEVIKGAIGGLDLEFAVQDQQRFADGGDDDLAADAEIVEFSFLTLAFGDVTEDENDAAQVTLVAEDGGRAIIDRTFGAILGDQNGAPGEVLDETVFDDSLNRLNDGLARDFMNDPEDGLDRQILGVLVGPAGERFGDGVQEGDLTRVVGDDDGIADAEERHTKPIVLAAGRSRPFRSLVLKRLARGHGTILNCETACKSCSDTGLR